jgi:anaerobic selenocysteine-containing dehydrogenase
MRAQGLKLSRRAFLTAATGALGGLLLSRFWPAPGSGNTEPAPLAPERFVPTTCWIGKQDCGMLARVINGRVVKFEGHPAHPRNLGRLCPKGMAQIIALYDPNRVKTPLIRTNEKGVPGQFRAASWEEALTLVAEKIKEVRAKDPRLLLWQKGRSKARAFYDEAFVKASGATKLHHGAFCSDAGYRACEYTIGFSGVLHPDFKHCRYLLAWGWNLTEAGGNKLCQITWPLQLLEAKEKNGLKVVLIDPRRRGGGPQIDEWLPIKPGTDLALALALAHVLVKRGYIDREYLTAHTNAPFLVQEDGHFFRVDGKEQVWDQASQSPQPPDTPGVQPALEGTFTHEGRTLKTAFQVFKEHIEPYTPEWAGPICGLDPKQIRKVAEELGQNALIGSTIVLEGVRLPYRPVGAMAYHMAQQELGFQAIRAIVIVFMLLGAIEAVGGLRSSFDRKVHPNFHALDTITIKEPPYNIYLKESKYFPINSNNSSLVAKVMLDPHKYGVNDVPEVCIVHMTNPAVSYADSPVVWEAYKRLKFVVVIDPWLSKTADLFADVVLPAATIEKYEGPLNVTDQYVEALSVRVPPIEPLFDSRGEIEIYLDLCEKAGILYGEGGYLDHLNKALNLKDPYTLDLTKKPTVREIFDRWARSAGFAQGIEYFEKYGVSVKPIPVHKLYACAWDPPYGGIRHRLYGESLLRYREEMRAAGAEEIYWRDYTPLPTWRPPTMEESPPFYDLYLISAKKIEHKQSRSSQIPLLAELAPTQYVAINPKTARERGIADGDWVWVESHNAVTGETRRLKVQARFYEGIRPDTVDMPHHYGEVARHPWAKDQGPSPNYLFFTGEGYVGMTADQSFHVKVRIYKA